MSIVEQLSRAVADYEMAIHICQRSLTPQPKLLDILKTNLIQKQKILLDLETNKQKHSGCVNNGQGVVGGVN